VTALPPGTVVHQDIERILFTEAEIHRSIERLAVELTRAYHGAPLTVVCVLKGSFVFVSDLVRRMPIPLQLSFASVSSYGGGTRPGALELTLLPPPAELAGRHLLLVDDILDSGRTLARMKAELLALGPSGVTTCVFLDKPARRVVPFEAEHRCFTVEDSFVVGYGLDFAGHYRNLPYVGTLKPLIQGPGAQAPGGERRGDGARAS
jgi:hypoxanthine phosphoribosyltransferase